MLSNAYFLAKFRFDTAENGPAKNLQNFQKFANLLNMVHRWLQTEGPHALRRAGGWRWAGGTLGRLLRWHDPLTHHPKICELMNFFMNFLIFGKFSENGRRNLQIFRKL